MPRRFAIVLTLVASLALSLVADAVASRLHPQPRIHQASTPEPVIGKVTPLKAKVGEKLTIVGKNFRSRSKTRVFFLRVGGGVTSVKPDSASKKRLVVTVPETVTALLRDTASATRFQIRVLTTRFGDPTKKSRSPLISAAPFKPGPGPGPGSGPGDNDHDGYNDTVDTDDDNDLVPDKVEINTTATDPKTADSDNDGITDGYEWQSAKDMNDTTAFNVAGAPLPYPGKRPWPNPLDPSDTTTDHDGDGLTMADEYKLWKVFGSHKLPLNYSDGLQVSQGVAPPHANPALPDYNPARAYMTIQADGRWTDDELDADGDGIGNWDESHGRLIQSFWESSYEHEKPYPNPVVGGKLEWSETDLADSDSDGDTVKDGADDQDYDGLSNAFELQRPADWLLTYISTGPVDPHAGTNPWARVNPYNPCKPVYSKTCHLHWPFKYYGEHEDWAGLYPVAINPPPAAPWLYAGES
jgi:IPT/TIG domain